MENGKGNDTWAEHIETLTRSGTPAARRELLAEIYSMPNYADRGWNRRHKFDPDYFDLAETTRAVMAALGTKLSYTPGAKTFTMPLAPEALREPLPGRETKRRTTREVTMSPDVPYGFFEELKKDGRDSRRATACAACGNPNDLKACSGCGQQFYCGPACQKVRLRCWLERGLTFVRFIGNLLTSGNAQRSPLQVNLHNIIDHRAIRSLMFLVPHAIHHAVHIQSFTTNLPIH